MDIYKIHTPLLNVTSLNITISLCFFFKNVNNSNSSNHVLSAYLEPSIMLRAFAYPFNPHKSSLGYHGHSNSWGIR